MGGKGEGTGNGVPPCPPPQRLQQLSLCHVELVKLLPSIVIVLIFFSYSGPLGISGSDGKQNTA